MVLLSFFVGISGVLFGVMKSLGLDVIGSLFKLMLI